MKNWQDLAGPDKNKLTSCSDDFSSGAVVFPALLFGPQFLNSAFLVRLSLKSSCVRHCWTPCMHLPSVYSRCWMLMFPVASWTPSSTTRPTDVSSSTRRAVNHCPLHNADWSAVRKRWAGESINGRWLIAAQARAYWSRRIFSEAPSAAPRHAGRALILSGFLGISNESVATARPVHVRLLSIELRRVGPNRRATCPPADSRLARRSPDRHRAIRRRAPRLVGLQQQLSGLLRFTLHFNVLYGTYCSH